MNMADAALPLEEGGGNDETDGKSLREALSESWNGQGYYAKLMAQMATPNGKGAKPEEEAHASGSGSGGAKKGNCGASSDGSARSAPASEVAMPSLAQVTQMFSAALPNLAAGARPAPVVLGKGKRTTHFAEDAEVPAMPAAAAPPPATAAPLGQPAVARAGARKVAAKEAPLSASISSTSRRAKKSAEETDASATAERKIETLEAALAAMKSELEAAKGEIETLHADSSLAERESESLQNTLDTQTAQLRSQGRREQGAQGGAREGEGGGGGSDAKDGRRAQRGRGRDGKGRLRGVGEGRSRDAGTGKGGRRENREIRQSRRSSLETCCIPTAARRAVEIIALPVVPVAPLSPSLPPSLSHSLTARSPRVSPCTRSPASSRRVRGCAPKAAQETDPTRR